MRLRYRPYTTTISKLGIEIYVPWARCCATTGPQKAFDFVLFQPFVRLHGSHRVGTNDSHAVCDGRKGGADLKLLLQKSSELGHLEQTGEGLLLQANALITREFAWR